MPLFRGLHNAYLKRPIVRTTGLLYVSSTNFICTWLSSHDLLNLELRHHQKFAVLIMLRFV